MFFVKCKLQLKGILGTSLSFGEVLTRARVLYYKEKKNLTLALPLRDGKGDSGNYNPL